MTNRKFEKLVSFTILTLLLPTACVTARAELEEPAPATETATTAAAPAVAPPATPPATPQVVAAPVEPVKPAAPLTETELRSRVESMQAKIESLESKLAHLNDEVVETRTSVENRLGVEKAKPTPAIPHSAEEAGTEIEPKALANDPEAGFINDAAISSYRQAMILFHSAKYPESTLAFSAFLERYPDHALAGSAQYRIGECYRKQKEYTLAIKEYERVMTSYDRSPAVADTLKAMSECQDALGKTDDAAKSRQQLMALFPQSPAAAETPNTVAQEAPSKAKELLAPLTDAPPLAPEAQQPAADPAAAVATAPAPATPPATAPAAIDPPPTAPLHSPEESAGEP